MEERQLVPNRRFRGFELGWEEKSFESLAEIVRGASPRPIEDPKWFDNNSNIGWLRISDVTLQNGRITNLEQKISVLGQQKTRVIKNSHLLLSIAATVGKPVINYVKTGVHDGFLIFLKPKFDIEYMYQWLEMFRSKWQQYGQPGSQVNLNSDIVKKHIFLIPELKEQQKIGEFFKVLDERIANQERKIAKVKALKDAYLTEMFPQEGETVPKRRFKGFDEEWESKSFNELAEVVRGASPRPIEDQKWFDAHSDIGWLRISDVTSQNGRITNLEQRLSILGQKKTRVIKSSHLLLSIAATVGKPVINYVETGVHDGFLIFLSPKFDIEYMYQWLEMFREEWQKYGQPGSQVNLNSDIIKQHIISIPTIKEQQKIGEFFKNLDNQIEMEHKKLDKLQKMKEAYLGEMFV